MNRFEFQKIQIQRTHNLNISFENKQEKSDQKKTRIKEEKNKTDTMEQQFQFYSEQNKLRY